MYIIKVHWLTFTQFALVQVRADVYSTPAGTKTLSFVLHHVANILEHFAEKSGLSKQQ